MLDRLGADPGTGGGKARGASAPSARALAGLTARELDVMLLVAAGNTSRQTGAALFISPRTVEMHVQGCLLKLGCRTRTEAVRKLAELGVLAGQPEDPLYADTARFGPAGGRRGGSAGSRAVKRTGDP
jgi:DNA-binding CsgD family transcriptional regulator